MVTSDGMAIFGVSDGGAHTKFFAGGRYTTDALIKMGRDNDILSLEELHFRLSNHPAMCAGFKNRGTLVEGNWPIWWSAISTSSRSNRSKSRTISRAANGSESRAITPSW
jgi:hypothetical protein